jgi:hypothetical protein
MEEETENEIQKEINRVKADMSKKGESEILNVRKMGEGRKEKAIVKIGIDIDGII